MAVYRVGSMTKAARELHLTQSGISQQIKALEEALGITLFDRIGRKIMPTAQADILFHDCSKHLDEIEHVFEVLSIQNKPLAGKVKIGFPPVFGNHVLLPVIAKFHKENPDVIFELRMGLAKEIVGLLNEGKLDFAFVDSFAKDSQLITEPVGKEYLDLCCRADLLDQFGRYQFSSKYFRKLPYVAYLHGEPTIRYWFQKNFKTIPHDLRVVATVIDNHAISRIIAEGMAVGLLPESLIQRLRDENDQIHIFKSDHRVANKISACYLAKRTMAPPAVRCLNEIRKALSGRKGLA